jgi:hypothetical protein
MATTSGGSNVVENSLKLLGEAFVAPGTSLIVHGEIAKGGAHVLAGLLAKAVLGPVGWFLVAANSYSTAVTGKGLLETVKS